MQIYRPCTHTWSVCMALLSAAAFAGRAGAGSGGSAIVPSSLTAPTGSETVAAASAAKRRASAASCHAVCGWLLRCARTAFLEFEREPLAMLACMPAVCICKGRTPYSLCGKGVGTVAATNGPVQHVLQNWRSILVQPIEAQCEFHAMHPSSISAPWFQGDFVPVKITCCTSTQYKYTVQAVPRRRVPKSKQCSRCGRSDIGVMKPMGHVPWLSAPSQAHAIAGMQISAHLGTQAPALRAPRSSRSSIASSIACSGTSAWERRSIYALCPSGVHVAEGLRPAPRCAKLQSGCTMHGAACARCSSWRDRVCHS